MSLSRQDFLLTVLAALGASAGSAEGQTRPPSPLPPSGDAATATPSLSRGITRLVLVGTGAPVGTTCETTAFLAQGDLPPGRTLVAALGGRATPLQADVSTRWPDGSAALVLLALPDPGLAAGQRADVVLSGAPVTARPAFNVAPFVRRSLEVSIAHGDARWTHTIPLEPTADRWRDGPLSLSWRVDVPVPSEALGGANAMHLVADVTLFADGTVGVVANHRNDIALRAPQRLVEGGRVSGTARRDMAVAARYITRLSLGGTEVARREVTQHPLGSWLPVEARVRLDARQAPEPCRAFPHLAHAYRAGIISHYVQDGYVPAERDAYVRAMTGADWNRPFHLRGIVPDMGRTGGRDDIGLVPKPSALALMSQDAAMARYVLDRSVALMGASWHWWLAEERTFLNQLDRPNLWLDVRDPRWIPGASEGAILGLDRSHQPNDHLVAYLLTGDRHRADALAAQAAWNLMIPGVGTGGRGSSQSAAQTPEGRAARLAQLRSGDGEGWLYERDGQQRGKSWARRQIVLAALLLPDAMQPAPGYYRDVLAANLRWYTAQRPAWTEAQGEVHGMLALAERGRPFTYAPWQGDFGVPASVQMVLAAIPGAAGWLRWQLNWLVGRFEHEPAFHAADGVQYSVLIGRPADPAGRPASPFTAAEVADWDAVIGSDVRLARTWRQLGDMARRWTRYPSNGNNFSAVTRPDIGGDYGVQAIIALTWLLHPALPWTPEERGRIRATLRWLLTAAPTKIFAHQRALVRVPHKNIVSLDG